MKIITLMEGGIGDFLCANRFVPSILSKNKGAELTLFANTDHNPKSAELLLKLWPSSYKGGYKLVTRKSPEFKVTSQFGTESIPALFNNLIEDDQKLIKSADKWYNLHIDGLEWLYADFNYLHNYYQFPEPELSLANYLTPFAEGNYVMAHLAARKGGAHELEDWHLKRFLTDFIRKTEHNLVVVTTEECRSLYDEVKDNPRVFICNPDLIDTFKIAKQCKMFIGVDSGIRYIPLHFGKPSFVFTKYSQSIGQASHSHLIRWLIFGKYCLPLNYNTGEVMQLINNIYKHPAYGLFPNTPQQYQLENIIVERKFID